ncbi:MFS transporter [Prescottella equi]|uniref:MFS transporter n=1 Tax=Rhodococcus hoagii TaxID=43767 RepID=A0AAP2AMX1_RHOHA|nr:MFS transporter [Prescottella equi]ERN47599.1 MFS transporter [Prescottella equi NBRC 101255 = C 7]MBM4627073.1 MFS transporter [Prescottella equi]QPQ79169.1 MFS transporter [Prescottella equi]
MPEHETPTRQLLSPVAERPPVPPSRTGFSNRVIAILAICGTVMTLQQTMILPVLPALPGLLGVSAGSASWLVTATLVTGAVVTPLIGRLADMFGKKRMIMLTLVVVVVGSAMGGLFTALPALVIARILQGCGLALVPVAIATMRDVLPAERVPGGVSAMGASLAIGSAAGLPLAGVLVNYLDWRGIFWVTAGCGVLLTAAVARIVPETSLRSRARFDCAGALLLAGALTSLLLALSKGAQWGWPATTALVGTGGLLIALWVPLQLRSRSPLVDLRVAARPRVLLVNVSSALVGFALFSNVLVSIQLLQTPRAAGFGFGLGILEAGLWMIPPTLVGVAMAPVAARAITRYGAWTTLLIATVEMAIVFVARVYLSTELWQVLVGAAAVGIGLSLAQAAIPILIMRSVPPSETASANGLSSLLRSIGTSTASATMAAVATAWAVRTVDGVLPTFDAFVAMFWISGAATLAAACLVALAATTSDPEAK